MPVLVLAVVQMVKMVHFPFCRTRTLFINQFMLSSIVFAGACPFGYFYLWNHMLTLSEVIRIWPVFVC